MCEFIVKSLKLGLIIGLITILLVGSVLAWSVTYDKRTLTYRVTLDSGKVVNVTDVYISNSDKTLNAVIHTDKLSIQEAVNLKNVQDDVILGLGGQKSEYDRNILVIQR